MDSTGSERASFRQAQLPPVALRRIPRTWQGAMISCNGVAGEESQKDGTVLLLSIPLALRRLLLLELIRLLQGCHLYDYTRPILLQAVSAELYTDDTHYKRR